MRPLLGTFVEIGIDRLATGLEKSAFDRAFAAVAQVQALLSFHDPHSELSRLNACEGRFVSLSPLTLRVLRAGRAMSIASGGLFNHTVGGGLVRLGVLPDHGGPPAMASGSAADVEIRVGEARLLRPVRITLDGIAKGYAVDHAARTLRQCGVEAGWINAGGDLCAFGELTVPLIRREKDGSMRTLGELRNASAATSVAGAGSTRFPSHIISSGCESAADGTWTVLAGHAWKADALTKVAALARASGRAELIRRLGGTLVGTPEVLN